ncbi:tripartite tricarboxylate transporter TctB family protein [Alteribacillus sp. YIM 98480]|uniref:tripartite tricarboxylate transporter TctB family protein n=1 Tax=Alteribacillus sp. YIM 98480 TaxID=2606599 RepID=UPI00131E101D|nr:tripartite tricarboxylate transporter TctB family protein [Alteribacillus sp. YIM 98480]
MSKQVESLFYLAIAVTCLFLVFMVFPENIPQGTGDRQGVSSGFFPTMAVTIIFITSILEAISLTRSKDKNEVRAIWSEGDVKRAAIIFAACITYVFIALETVGFYIATPVFLIGVIWFLGEKSWWKLITAAVVVILIVHFLLAVQLGVTLPQGFFSD